ncbi:MAG TPA: AAA family ATPase [Dehalococcoidia bacterium]|nr:AAA family ATPase [Dehalococcoidia bacterium]
MPQDRLGVRVHLLGRFEVKAGDRVIIDQCWPRRKAKALLKHLAINVDGHWIHREQLLDALWPELEPAAADHNFRQNLHYLRQAFEEHGLVAPVVTAAQSMVGLAPETWVDVEAFREAHQAARQVRTDPKRYVDALKLYGGDLLPEDIYEEWTQAPREELKGLRRQLVLDLASLHELRGEGEAAIQRLEALVRLDQLDEEAHRGLIQLYAVSGNRQRAQRQFERCRDALQRELGVEPSEETEAIHQRVLEGRLRTVAKTVPPGGTFIGRARELGVLLAGLEKALHGRGVLFMLVGEAGIGKTRTAEEIAVHAYLRGAQVIWGRCYEGEGASAFWPWVQVLRTCMRENTAEDLRSMMGSGAAQLLNLLPELRGTLPELPTAPAGPAAPVSGLPEPFIDIEQARFRLFDSVGTFLSNMAKRQPLVLVLDDLHCADELSLLLLQFLAGMVADTRLLVLGTYRDTELTPDHPLSTSVAVMERRHPGHTIHFEGFSEEEVAQMMQASTGQEQKMRVTGAVFEQTGGNPLLVHELSRVLLAAGLPEQALDSPGWGIALPRGAQAVILHSMYRLSGPCQQVLAAAAVAGKEFDLRLLSRLAGLPGLGLHEAIDEAISAQVIVRFPGNPGHFAFRHTLLREALYGHLPAIRRAHLHRVVGETLEQIYGTEAEHHAAELAHHFLAAAPAGTATAAVQYARMAADHALALFAYEEAARLYQKALDVASAEDGFDDIWLCELLLSLGHAKWDAGDPAAGKEAFLAAGVCARQRGDYAQLARAALGCGRSLTSLGTVDQPHVDFLEEALAGLPDEETSLRAMVMASLARALYWSPNEDRRSTLSREAVDLSRQGGDKLVLAHVLDAAWVALWRPDNPKERLELATEMLQLADAARDQARAHQGHRWRMIAFLELGDMDAARRESQEQARIAHELRHSAQLENAAVIAAMWALFEGRLDEAEQLANEALISAQSAHDRAAAEQFGAQTVALFRERGRLHEIEPVVRAFADQNPAVAAWRAVLAWVYSELGKEPEARAELGRLADGEFASLHRDYTWLLAMSLLADVCEFVGDHPRAASLYRQLLPFADRNVVMGYAIVCAGSVFRSLGVLAATMRQWGDAEAHFDKALRMNERMGARTWLAWTQYEYARMLAERDTPGDVKRASCLLGQALRCARELQMGPLEARILALTLSAEQSP